MFVELHSQSPLSWLTCRRVIGPLQDSVTRYGINYTGTQMTQWDFQNKGKSGWTGKSSIVLEVPRRYLRPSVIYSVPCDRILQRAYWPYIFTLDDWLTKNQVNFFNQSEEKPKPVVTSGDLLARVFPGFVSATPNYVEFWLVHCCVLYDWLERSL